MTLKTIKNTPPPLLLHPQLSIITPHTAIPADLFDSVIDNLLGNAYIKRRAETGIGITVTLQSEVRSVCLRVCDQGSAIAAARANELF